MRPVPVRVDDVLVTATAAVSRVGKPARAAARPAPASPVHRLAGTLHEPNTWTVGILLATGIAILARHPIAHAIGTEVDAAPTPVASAQPSAPGRAAPVAPALSLPVVAVPTHAPRDPFRVLVAAGASAVNAPAVRSHAPAPAGATSADAGTCAATHRVSAGESLWTIAARATRSTDTDRVTLAWHRVYDANRGRIGSDPSVLAVGMPLCIPQTV